YQAQLAERLEGRMQQILYRKRHELELYIEKMKCLSPLERLSGGYSYVEDDSGKNIRSVKRLREGEIVRIRMRDGSAEAKILGISGQTQADF
ncbi:MAG: exodeoxyribonuclease VII large subunit, partial [Lachnospiraceae bacterium]|nr:exodeoxyribonuclease VII large subunit [Lachnospiraceae bacterium]